MRIDIATLFPAMCEAVLQESIVGRARAGGLLSIHTHNIRDYTQDKHRRVDDYPYGGGCGMLMQAQPIADCCRAIRAQQQVHAQRAGDGPGKGLFIRKKACFTEQAFHLGDIGFGQGVHRASFSSSIVV